MTDAGAMRCSGADRPPSATQAGGPRASAAETAGDGGSRRGGRDSCHCQATATSWSPETPAATCWARNSHARHRVESEGGSPVGPWPRSEPSGAVAPAGRVVASGRTRHEENRQRCPPAAAEVDRRLPAEASAAPASGPRARLWTASQQPAPPWLCAHVATNPLSRNTAKAKRRVPRRMANEADIAFMRPSMGREGMRREGTPAPAGCTDSNSVRRVRHATVCENSMSASAMRADGAAPAGCLVGPAAANPVVRT